MKSRSLLILSIGFGTLILLIGLLGVGAMQRSRALHEETLAAHDAYLEADTVLRAIPAELYLSGSLIRDYILDPSHLLAPYYREQLLARRVLIQQKLDVLDQRLGDENRARLQQLRLGLQSYWNSMDPILDWAPEKKSALSSFFLRQQVLPRRDAVLALAQEIGEINAANLRKEQERLRSGQDLFRDFLERTLAIALSLGLLVALISIARVSALERRGDLQRERTELAEAELRRLSRNLVHTQEEERRSLSRELHDAIGQMLAAMTMELGNLETSIQSPDKLRVRLDEARRLNAETIRGVRNLAAALRPAMLDELGLAPALRWQAREFSRRSGVPVSVQIDGVLEELPETHRTCIYRVVQEALTNCAKHARAEAIRVALYGRPGLVRLTIQDDGIGLDSGGPSPRGLGLIGIHERVRELDGKINIISQPRKGTILEIELPITRGASTE